MSSLDPMGGFTDDSRDGLSPLSFSLTSFCSSVPDTDEETLSTGLGPPKRGIHFWLGTAKRPATTSGYSATTLAGLRSSSINVSIAESNLDSRNSDTAFKMRIRVRLDSYENPVRSIHNGIINSTIPCLREQHPQWYQEGQAHHRIGQVVRAHLFVPSMVSSYIAILYYRKQPQLPSQ